MEDIWAEGAASLFFSESGISKMLGGDAPPALAALLAEDDIIQETQAQSVKLIAFLTQPHVIDELLSYVAVPVDPAVAGEDRAYKCPFRACEVLACAVPALLDAVVDRRRRHLDVLFNVFTQRAPGELPPYLYGYCAKVVAVLCKHRPSAMTRYLDHAPGVGPGLFRHMGNGSVASVAQVLLALPWGPGQSMLAPGHGDVAADERGAGPFFTRYDGAEASLPALCLSTMKEALAPAVSNSSKTSPEALETAVGASQAVASLVTAALRHGWSSAPHSKYAVEGYASSYIQAKRAAAGETEDAAHSSSSSSAAPSHAGRPSTNAAALEAAEPFCVANTQVDRSLLASTLQPSDSVYVRLLKAFRDGSVTAPALVALATEAAAALASPAAAGADATALQAVCEAALTVMKAAIGVAASSWTQVRRFGGGTSDARAAGAPTALTVLLRGAEAAASAESSSWSDELPCPTLLKALCVASNGQASPLAALVAAAGDLCRNRGSRSTGADGEEEAAAYPSYVGAPRLGVGGLALFGCLAALTRCGWPSVAAAVVQERVFSVLLDAYAAFPWHSLLHNAVTEALLEAIAHAPPELLTQALLRDGRLLTRTVHGLRAAGMAAHVDAPPAGPSRGGYGPHIASLANHLVVRLEAEASNSTSSSASSALASLASSHSDFWRTFDRQVAAFNVRRGVLVAGMMAPDSRKSGQVGANADATGRPAAVDEVSALDDGSDSDEEGSTGSGSDDEEKGGRHSGGVAFSRGSDSEEEEAHAGLHSGQRIAGSSARGWGPSGAELSSDEEEEADESGEEDGAGLSAAVTGGQTSAVTATAELPSDASFDAAFSALDEALDDSDEDSGAAGGADWTAGGWDDSAAASATSPAAPASSAPTDFGDFDAFPAAPAPAAADAADFGDFDAFPETTEVVAAPPPAAVAAVDFDDFGETAFPPAPAPASAPSAVAADADWDAAFDVPSAADAKVNDDFAF